MTSRLTAAGVLVRLALALVLFVTAGCGKHAKEAKTAGADDEDESSFFSSGPVTIEYVPIAVAWVKHHVKTTPAELKAWAKTPAAKGIAKTKYRQVLVRLRSHASARQVAAAKRRIAQILDRIADGEKVEAIARDESDDDATRDAGGVVGEDPSALDGPLRAAAAALAPGEFTNRPVRDASGLHILARDPIDPMVLEKTFKKARATEVTRKLAEEIMSRMHSSDASAEEIFKASVAAILGQDAVDDPKRHPSGTLPADHAADADLPKDAKDDLALFAKHAHPGDVVDSPLGTGPVVVVARAVVGK